MNKASILLLFTLISGQLPYDHSLMRSTPNQLSEGLKSNAVIDLRYGTGNSLYVGSGNGLGYADVSDALSPTFYTVVDDSLPEGGIPALKTYSINEDSFMVVLSGAESSFEEADGKWHSRGSGISWSFDDGMSWHYIEQPVDKDGEPGGNINFDWYGQELRKKVWHTTVDNVSYDLAVDLKRKYIYSTSWGGGVKRFNYEDQNWNWKTVPLPMDDQDSLYCGEIDAEDYYFSPIDPPTGSYNHKPFSVHVVEDTVWVGTAGGVNKGIYRADGCLNWTHYNTEKGIGGDWVIGIIPQEFDNYTRLWLISWISPDAPHPLTYTDDGGATWKVVNQLLDQGIITYNLSFSREYIIAATDHGIYLSNFDDGKFWMKLPITSDLTGEKILTEKMYSAISIGDEEEIIMLGTADGLSLISSDRLTKDNIRFWEPASPFSAYPNPFFITHEDYHQIGIDNFVRFVYSNPNNYSGSIDIFDFAMDKVIQLNNPKLVNQNESEMIWNGRNVFGDKVANGVYFCRLSLNSQYHWTKLAVIN